MQDSDVCCTSEHVYTEEKFCCHIFKDWVSQYVTEKWLSSYEQRSLAWAGIQSCLLSSEQETATKQLASSDFMSEYGNQS